MHKLLKWTFFILCIVSTCASWSQSTRLLVHYPLQEDGKEQQEKIEDLQLLNIDFTGKAAYTNGFYDDFDAGRGNLIMTPPIEELDYTNFSVSIWFKVSEFKRMPVLVMGKSCRLLAFYLSGNGTVMLKANNMEINQKSTTTYQLNTWHQATIVYSNSTATIFLDNKKAAQSNVLFSTECTTEWNNNDFGTTNFSNGESFRGYLKDLKIYNDNTILNEEVNKASAITTISETTNNEKNNTMVLNDNFEKTSTTTDYETSASITTPLGELKKRIFITTGTPPDAIKMQQSQQRLFFLLKNSDGNSEIIWQDIQNKKINLTKFNSALTTSQTSILSSEVNTRLLAATNDPDGNYYYIVFKTNNDQKTNDVITLYKANKDGAVIKKQLQSSGPNDLNIFRVNTYAGTLKYQKGCLLFLMGRIMNQSDDGLKHQGGIGVAFDPETLLITKNFGQTSGHSFDNFLDQAENGNFIAIDLGDNYPRGINLHRFSSQDKASKVIYTFKTQHGTESGGYDGSKSYPLYAEISTPTQKYYKWSNDNETYTELGGVVEVIDGYCVIFAGEPDPNGRSLNSSRIGKENKDPRNLGFIKIRKDFDQINATDWNVVPKELMLSHGISEKGGFYTFGGDWTKQANEGVMWLSKYKNAETENVKFIKTALLSNGTILILFGKDKKESWENSEKYSSFMTCIGPDGSIIVPAFDLGSELRLNRRDEIIVIGSQVMIVQGNEKDKTIQLFTLDLK